MYRGSSPAPPVARKSDPTAAARSPIRRTPSRPLSVRSQRRQSANAESLFLSSQSSPYQAPREGAIEPYSVPGNYSAAVPVDNAAPGQPAENAPPLREELTDTLPFIRQVTSIAHYFGAQPSRDSTRTASAHTNESTRRMQVTRQRPTRRASLEADMGRFVVRPILSDDEAGARATQSPTVDPMELLVVPAPIAPPSQQGRSRVFIAPAERVRRRDRARSRSPRRRSTAPRIEAPSLTGGLGDRQRSPSVEAEESDWETLRATIQPDAQLPSASSSFTSASATSSSFDAQTASAPSSATTSAASSFVTNHRYVLPTAECLDITTAQRECGVVCDDARDALPPFAASRGPTRPTTREPSADRPRTRRRRSPATNVPPAHTGFLPPIQLVGPMYPTPPRTRATSPPPPADAADMLAAETGSTAPVHLRSPASEAEAFDFSAFISPGPALGQATARSPSPTVAMAAIANATTAANEDEAETDGDNPAQARLGQRIAEVQLQWHQLRRINELLRCGREVPGWLWEVAGLAPELQVREFEI